MSEAQKRKERKTETPGSDFVKLLDYLKSTRGFDFSGYKIASLMRRVQKRMQQVGVASYVDYIDYLEVHPDEFLPFFNTLLINVTGFFRDPQAWQVLAERILPRILDSKGPDEPIRCWSAGCASGEEAYTLAMLLVEALGDAEELRRRVKIYATDVDEEALAQARQGSYSAAQVADVPEALRAKYFERAGDRHVFRPDLRRALIFGRHDLVQDAAISRLDLLVCRNTMMYFNAETQAKILARFHFALNRHGYLFLGKAETLLSHSNNFQPEDLKARIFQRTPSANLRDRLLAITPAAGAGDPQSASRPVRVREAVFDASPVAQIAVDRKGHLVLANERARRLFGLNPADLGRPLQDFEISYRPVELRSHIEAASTSRVAVTLKNVEWRPVGGEPRMLEIQVLPLFDGGAALLGIGVSFWDQTLQYQLHSDLERTHQELETAYEELQSSNEELETTNEELQSTVEELETTNEERPLPRGDEASVRAILHHEGARPGDRAGAGDRPRHRASERRPYLRGERAGPGHALHRPAAALRRGDRTSSQGLFAVRAPLAARLRGRAARGGRRQHPRARGRGPGEPGLPGARRQRCHPGAGARRGAPGAHPHPRHRRGDAGPERQPARSAARQPPAGPAGAVHLGLSRGLHRPPWRAPPGSALPAEALPARAVPGQGAGGVGRPGDGGDRHLAIEDSRIHLSRNATENGHRPAIDVLFRSAARSYGNRVVGVVLTGNLDDGTAGLAAIKRCGGVAVVQDPREADYSAMPESAIANVEVDHVLPVADIGALLDRLLHEPRPDVPANCDPLLEEEPDAMGTGRDDIGKANEVGEPSALTCPDCGGTLFERPGEPLLHFRCRTGHAYSPESLLAQQSESLEAALWAALRALEENGALARRMEKRTGDQGNVHSAKRYRQRAADAEKHAKTLRGMLEHGGADLEVEEVEKVEA